jgi:O-acetylserine/cysteine efflux transporter
VVGITAGMLVLGESVSPWQWAGIVLVVAALACVLLGPALGRRLRRAPA